MFYDPSRYSASRSRPMSAARGRAEDEVKRSLAGQQTAASLRDDPGAGHYMIGQKRQFFLVTIYPRNFFLGQTQSVKPAAKQKVFSDINTKVFEISCSYYVLRP